MRFMIFFVSVSLLIAPVTAETPSFRKAAVLCTYRLEHARTSGTCFVVSQPDPAVADEKQFYLVTAAHVFKNADSDQMTLALRRLRSTGEWVANPVTLVVRTDGKPTYHKHPKLDIAVLQLSKEKVGDIHSIPAKSLATAADWEANAPEPGALVRCVGFPHAAQFKPDEIGFALTRLGCMASYPVGPSVKRPTFLVDYNSFEGDSGGLVYVEDRDGSAKIIGIVQGQHFIDEKYKLIYQEGMVRKRLGLAIIVPSQAILETINGITN